MKIIPCGHRLLVRADVAVEKDDAYVRAKAMGIEIAKSTVAQEQTGMDRGTVLDIGPTCWQHSDYGGNPWCGVGDRVIYAKHAGKVIEQDGEFLVLLNDEDVVAVIKE